MRRAGILIAIAACRPAPPEPLPTMEKRPRPIEEPVAAAPARCPAGAVEAAWIGDRMLLCAPRPRDGGMPYTCAIDDLVYEEHGLPWTEDAESPVDISADTIAEWTEDGAVTLRDRATLEPVQTVTVAVRGVEVTLSVADGRPVTLRGWSTGGCDFLLHFGGDG
jgi:hypothetical protein